MSKTNLQKLHGTQAGIRSTISMFVETVEESKEQLNIQQFRPALEDLEMEKKALYEVNEKIMAATNAEHMEEEMVTTRKESFKLKLTLIGLRDFQRQNDAKDSNVDRNSQTEQGADGRFDEQIVLAEAAESQNNLAGIDAGADGSRCDATVIVNRDVRRQAETQQTAKYNLLLVGHRMT